MTKHESFSSFDHLSFFRHSDFVISRSDSSQRECASRAGAERSRVAGIRVHPVFAQLRRGTHTPSGSYPIVKLRNPNDEKSSSGQMMKSFHALSFPRHAMPVRLGPFVLRHYF